MNQNEQLCRIHPMDLRDSVFTTVHELYSKTHYTIYGGDTLIVNIEGTSISFNRTNHLGQVIKDLRTNLESQPVQVPNTSLRIHYGYWREGKCL